MNRDLKKLEETIGYSFHNKRLLSHAMTHSSYANEHRWEKTRCNERLEFLGDAVLELVSSDFLFHTYGDLPEGDLTKTRASLGKGEEATGGRRRHSVVSDGLAALIGAIYLDGGFASAKEFILRFILNDIEHKQLFYDSKTILQEMVQSQYEEPLTYQLLKEEGPDHNKSFEVCARIGEREIGKGSGRTKKAAEQVAAYNGILTIKDSQVCI